MCFQMWISTVVCQLKMFFKVKTFVLTLLYFSSSWFNMKTFYKNLDLWVYGGIINTCWGGVIAVPCTVLSWWKLLEACFWESDRVWKNSSLEHRTMRKSPGAGQEKQVLKLCSATNELCSAYKSGDFCKPQLVSCYVQTGLNVWPLAFPIHYSIVDA